MMRLIITSFLLFFIFTQLNAGEIGENRNETKHYIIAKLGGTKYNVSFDDRANIELNGLAASIEYNNRYNCYDQVIGEEFATLSILHQNPYFGLSILYSYFDYSQTSSHKIAAMNIIRFIANDIDKPELINEPGGVKYLSINEIRRLTKKHFSSLLKIIDRSNDSRI